MFAKGAGGGSWPMTSLAATQQYVGSWGRTGFLRLLKSRCAGGEGEQSEGPEPPRLKSFRSLTRRRPIEQRHFQPGDFLQRPACDALQVAIEAGHRLDDAVDLFFALRP